MASLKRQHLNRSLKKVRNTSQADVHVNITITAANSYIYNVPDIVLSISHILT